MLNMDNSEFTFKWRLFKYDPAIRAVKKKLKYNTTGPILINHTVNKKLLFLINRKYSTYKPGYFVTYEINHTVNKKLLFLINRKYSTYKPGYFVTYEDHAQQRQLRVEEWVELKKGIHRLTAIAAVKNNTPEGESLKLSW